MKDVRISAVLNGWIVKVGCQQLVFTDMKTLLQQLETYLKNPKDTERWYLEHSVNAGTLRDVAYVAEDGNASAYTGQDEPERPGG